MNEFRLNQRFQFKETPEDDHVEYFGKAKFPGLISCGDGINVDILAHRDPGDAVGVVNQQSSWFYSFLEFVEGLLVEDDGCVK